MKETKGNEKNVWKVMITLFIGFALIGSVFIDNYFSLKKEMLKSTTDLQLAPVSFELEGSCDTGFIGIDYRSVFVNSPYKDLANSYFTRNRNVTYYDTQYLPQQLNLKNINGLKCTYKLKITASTMVMEELTRSLS